MPNQDQEFVEYIVKAIVDSPDKVNTNRRVDEMGVLVELEVAPEDMGKIIGKEGKTAKSIRTLLRVLGAKNNARVNLKIIEPEGYERPARPAMPSDVAAPANDTAVTPMADAGEQPAEEKPTEPATTPIEEEKVTEVL